VFFALWAGVFGVFGAGSAAANPVVKITVSSPGEVKIRIESLAADREWSFRNAYAGVLGLAERVEQFRAFADDGKDLGAKKIATGEFRNEASAATIEYVVRLALPSAADVGHVSWIARDSGFLMLADLLPQQLTDVLVTFSLSGGWGVATALEPDGQAEAGAKYHVVAPENAIFFLARMLGRQSKTVNGVVIETLITGSWPFKEATVMKAATKVLEKYLELTGFKLKSKTAVMIAPLPVATGSVKWRAETRGSTVVLLLDPNAQINNWPGQLGIIFTHELLHLWVPNSLRLDGDYDWFFEGFTLYTALVTALELKFIDFPELVATLGRVYDSYLSRPDELSLIDASERRWTSGNSVVYDKGMLVAFLYDLGLRKDSGGKTRLANLYRKLFARAATQPANGNEVIIQLLSSTPTGADLAKNYIEGQREIDIKPLLADQKLLKSLYR
jgi:predicted metalloprotease with PDZ domain